MRSTVEASMISSFESALSIRARTGSTFRRCTDTGPSPPTSDESAISYSSMPGATAVGAPRPAPDRQQTVTIASTIVSRRTAAPRQSRLTGTSGPRTLAGVLEHLRFEILWIGNGHIQDPARRIGPRLEPRLDESRVGREMQPIHAADDLV